MLSVHHFSVPYWRLSLLSARKELTVGRTDGGKYIGTFDIVLSFIIDNSFTTLNQQNACLLAPLKQTSKEQVCAFCWFSVAS